MSEIVKHYDDYYGDPELTRWRDLGAKDKAINIVRLWTRERKPAFPERVVDIGCGDGAVIEELTRLGLGREYVGFEVSTSGIDAARRRTYLTPTDFRIFDGTHLPVADDSFDLAVLSHVVEHLEDPRTLIREAARVATYLFVEVPLEMHLRTPRDFQWTDLGHLNLYTPLLIRHLVQSSGLIVLGERVTCPRLSVFKYQRPGLGGLARWAVKAGLLKTAPWVACRLFTYHGSLLAKRSGTPSPWTDGTPS